MKTFDPLSLVTTMPTVTAATITIEGVEFTLSETEITELARRALVAIPDVQRWPYASQAIREAQLMKLSETIHEILQPHSQ
jgi:hypothetical protein